jgi:copper(I)-binding protein
MMKHALLPIAALGLLAACSPGGEAAPKGGELPTVTVAEALCRPTPNGRRMTACYLTLTATGDDRLVSVSSPRAGRVEIHESRMEGGMMMMTELREGIVLPAGQAVQLKPGGNHLMLLGVTEPMAAGESIALTLTFEKAAAMGVHAPVATPPVGEGPPMAH